jgi:hypothetical protein
VKKKGLIALILIIAVIVTIFIVVIANPQMSLKVVGEQTKVQTYPDRLYIKISFNNPTQFTLFDCKITVQYLMSNGTYKKFNFGEYQIEPFQEKSRLFSVNSLNPNIDNITNGFICEGYGYLKPLPVSWDSPVL